MKEIEVKLRAGMTQNGIPHDPRTRSCIISSFALYGFPESHSASFALLAYASAFLKVRYPAAFTCGIVELSANGLLFSRYARQDAQRHGLKVRPVHIGHSEWKWYP